VIIRLMQRAPIRTLSYIPRLASHRTIHTTLSKMAASASTANPSTLAVPLNKTAHAFDKGQLDAMLSRRFFYAPAFEIYGGELIVAKGDMSADKRCRWIVRLWTTRFCPSCQYRRPMAKTLHYRRRHVGARHNHYDLI
jgi:hypothetical protein